MYICCVCLLSHEGTKLLHHLLQVLLHFGTEPQTVGFVVMGYSLYGFTCRRLRKIRHEYVVGYAAFDCYASCLTRAALKSLSHTLLSLHQRAWSSSTFWDAQKSVTLGFFISLLDSFPHRWVVSERGTKTLVHSHK